MSSFGSINLPKMQTNHAVNLLSALYRLIYVNFYFISLANVLSACVFTLYTIHMYKIKNTSIYLVYGAF